MWYYGQRSGTLVAGLSSAASDTKVCILFLPSFSQILEFCAPLHSYSTFWTLPVDHDKSDVLHTAFVRGIALGLETIQYNPHHLDEPPHFFSGVDAQW